MDDSGSGRGGLTVNSRGGEREGAVGSSDFDIFIEIPYASCVIGLALIF
jgi:hypothetical protein